ncbi:MAG TPA: Nramp family divalent metal transporter [Bryobacteraceae bacterium]|nr:Nramp family divalent metal transporter [Bryobacteraceae bacterium]
MIQDRPMDAQRISLADVHESVHTAHPYFWRRMLAFAGPAYLISVGYMDPGNWATDLEGGARFGYRLLWVLVMSNFMAILLQTLSARLGIVTRRDLAQACRDEYSKSVSIVLWLLCELAIVACDLAEVLGAAIGLNLLFHLPLLIGVFVTALDTLLVLWFTRLGIRVIEAFVLVLIATIAGCFAFEIFFAQPHFSQVLGGLLPRLNSQSLYVAVGIIGATVMPHNLYLHSALVQTRRIGETPEEKRRACKFNFLDSSVALNAALFVNAAILILAASVFFKRGIVVTEIQQAHQLLAPLLGTTAASVLFGAALLCSGQSSTLTGTMAGQVVMEGFLHFKMQPWLRRLVTRCLAITPAALTIYFAGDSGSYQLLILSQVVLNLQLPFAVIPLIQFTNDRKRMGEFANGLALKIAAWVCAAVILVLDLWLIWTEMEGWVANSGRYQPLVLSGCILVGIGFCVLLAVTVYGPRARRKKVAAERIAVELPAEPTPLLPSRTYSTIMVPLDHSPGDREAIGNALALARMHGARLVLLHVEEGVTSQIFGSLASTAEVTEGVDYLNQVVSSLRQLNVAVDVVVRHGSSPAKEIVDTVREIQPDLLVMASHGHRGIKDLVFGTTINDVRHHVKVPMLIVSST